MLTRFEVEGFRNFSYRCVLDLADVRDYRFNVSAVADGVVSCGIIYGKNAIGKTNFSNALLDISANVGRRVFYSNQTNYLSAADGVDTAHFVYVFRFGKDEVEYRYEKTGISDYVRESVVVNGTLALDYDHVAAKVLDGDLTSIGADRLNWEFKSPGISVLSYVCNNTPFDGSLPLFKLYTFARSIDSIGDVRMNDRAFVSVIAESVIENGLVDELQAFLSEFGIEERLVARETPSGDIALYFEKSRLIPFAENCSSGTVALLRLFNYFHITQAPSLLFVDEFDVFYHHDLAERVVNYFKCQTGRQVICASHNTDLFSNKVLRPDCLYILSDHGITSAANATNRELREGHNLEKLYKAGEFDV